MNRPPEPYEIIGYNLDNIENWGCMQEALTAEWLIEYGFMPDPTDYEALKQGGVRGMIVPGFNIILNDKDPDGEPSDYKVKQ